MDIVLLQIGTNLDLDSLKFQSGEGGGNPVFLGIFLAIVAVIAAVVLYFYITRRARFAERTVLREHARLRLMLSESNLDAEDKALLEALVETDDPTAVIPLLSTRTLFESRVEEFRMVYPESPVVKKVPKLRHRLGYGFDNPRNPFTSTRMLRVGTKMQCIIPHPQRPLTYITTVLGNGEENFFIRPPFSKGTPVSLAQVKRLNFTVSRDGDAEYEFSTETVGQSDDEARAVSMEHTSEIQKLLYREAPRSPVDLELEFFVIKQEVAAEKKHQVFRRGESQYSMKGRALDLSLGGMRVVAEVGAQKPVEGDLLVFRLPGAQIKEDIVAEILFAESNSAQQMQIHLRLSGLKEINRLKLNKFLQMQQKRADPAESKAVGEG